MSESNEQASSFAARRPSCGWPVAYTPNPAHNMGTAPLPGLIRAMNADGTAELVVFLAYRAEPAHLDNVPQGTGAGTWALPN